MKKAAKRKIFRKPKIKGNSLLLFTILAIAIVGFIVWAVIAKSPGKTPHAASASCRLTSNPNYKGEILSMSYNGFAAGESILLVDKQYGSTGQSFGGTVDSLNGTAYLGLPLSAHPGAYTLLIHTRYPAINFPCGDVNVIEVTACSFTPQYVNTGASATVSSNGYGLPVNIRNRFTGQVYALNKLNGDNNLTSVFIPTAVYPNPYDMYLQKPDGSTYPCTTIGDGHLWVTSQPVKLNSCDFNSDGHVDSQDVEIVRSHVGLVDKSGNNIYDVNHSGVVSLADVLVVLNNNPTYCK